MFNIDADLVSGVITVASLLIIALLAIIAGRRTPAETFTETFHDPHKWS
jgi:hypothetical protein